MLAIILNDGTTWTNIEGCKIVDVPKSTIESNFNPDADDFNTLYTFGPQENGFAIQMWPEKKIIEPSSDEV